MPSSACCHLVCADCYAIVQISAALRLPFRVLIFPLGLTVLRHSDDSCISEESDLCPWPKHAAWGVLDIDAPWLPFHHLMHWCNTNPPVSYQSISSWEISEIFDISKCMSRHPHCIMTDRWVAHLSSCSFSPVLLSSRFSLLLTQVQVKPLSWTTSWQSNMGRKLLSFSMNLEKVCALNHLKVDRERYDLEAASLCKT